MTAGKEEINVAGYTKINTYLTLVIGGLFAIAHQNSKLF